MALRIRFRSTPTQPLNTSPICTHAGVVIRFANGMQNASASRSTNHVIDLPRSPTTDIHWHYRCTSLDPESVLLDAVAALDWSNGHVDVFVKGEAAEVRAVWRSLIAERGVDEDTASISPY